MEGRPPSFPWYLGIVNFHLGISLDLQEAFLTYHKAGKSLNARWRLIPGAPDLLAELRQRGIHTGLISNWDSTCRRVLAETGLNKLLDTVVISSEIGMEKPDPGIFETALRMADVPLPTAISSLMQLGIAVPSFWLSILLILIFSVVLRWLPSGDFVPFSESLTGALRSLLLPAVSISIGTTAVVIRYLKNTLLDQMSMDYVRTARSKGLSGNAVLYRHILKNALLPAVTILGMIAVDVLGGSIIVENVYNLPGIGRLIISGVGNALDVTNRTLSCKSTILGHTIPVTDLVNKLR